MPGYFFIFIYLSLAANFRFFILDLFILFFVFYYFIKLYYLFESLLLVSNSELVSKFFKIFSEILALLRLF